MEEVTTDTAGECVGNTARLRIKVDITKPLKKMIVLKEEKDGDQENRSEEEMRDEEVTEENEDKKVTEVHMPVIYDRLPDFWFYCGIIGHQFRECIKYKNQPQDKLEYSPHLKFITTAEKVKHERENNRGKPENSKSYEKIPAQTAMEAHQTGVKLDNVSTQIQSDVKAIWGGRFDNVEMAENTQFMQGLLNSKGLENSCAGQNEVANEVTAPRKMSKENVKKGKKKQETQILSQNVEMSGAIKKLEKVEGKNSQTQIAPMMSRPTGCKCKVYLKLKMQKVG